jgi:FkbM family methyltransferase
MWHATRQSSPPLQLCSRDHIDATALLDVAGLQFWWPSEFPFSGLTLVWAEVFLPFPPNGHAYEHGQCRITPGNWVIDAGACEGFFVAYALRRGASVLAIEPVPRLAYCLAKTFDVEVKRGQVAIVNALLGSTTAEGFITLDPSPVAAHRSASAGERVAGTTIDALLAASVIPTVDFIKMDIEGAEVGALSGARATLRRYRPCLSLAIYHNAPDERQVKDMIVALGADYDIHVKGLARNRGKLLHQVLHACPRKEVFL